MTTPDPAPDIQERLEALTAKCALLSASLAQADKERDRYADCLRTVCGHLELPHSESGPCDDPMIYDRALDSLDCLYREAVNEDLAQTMARHAYEVERDRLLKHVADIQEVVRALAATAKRTDRLAGDLESAYRAAMGFEEKKP